MGIYREKPNFEELNRLGYKIADMHIHSNYSPDCGTKVEEIIKIAKRKNIGIAITDHNAIGGSLEASKYDIFLIPGIEITCMEGCHILAYFESIKDLKEFYNKYIKDNLYNEMRTKLPVKKLIKISHKYNCILVGAHPFGGGKSGIFKIKKSPSLKILEGLNARTLRILNNKTLKLKNRFYV